MLPSAQTSTQYLQRPLSIDVIAIQSQVIYGCVGNSIAIPILQQHGLTAVNVPTVLFSNTPLYPTIYGGIIPDDWFRGFLTALEEREILVRTRAIMLGYLGSPAQAETLGEWLPRVTKQYPDIHIQIDPVLGDINCGMYVDPALARYYRENLHRYAHGMTPNHFELSYLSGKTLSSINDIVAAARDLLSDTTRWIITTSAAPKTWKDGFIQYVIVTADSVEIAQHPYYKTTANGTGDAFAAGLVANLLAGLPLIDAAQKAAEGVMKIVQRTNQAQVNELLVIA